MIVFNLDSGKDGSSIELNSDFKAFEHELPHFLQVKCAFGAVRTNYFDASQILSVIYL